MIMKEVTGKTKTPYGNEEVSHHNKGGKFT